MRWRFDVSEPRRSIFQGNSGPVRREADGVVPAAEHQDVEQRSFVELLAELTPQPVVDVGVVVQRVDRSYEELVTKTRPARVGRPAVGERGDLLAGQADTFSEEGDVDPPLVLTPTAGAGPVDNDLSDPAW